MTKFRVLTTENEWVYTQINVLEDRIVCPILDAKGCQLLKPNLKLRPETLGMLVYENAFEKGNVYEGDIINALFYNTFNNENVIAILGEVKKEEETWVVKSVTSYLSRYWKKRFTRELDSLSEATVIGNIHQNSELLREKKT